MDIFWDEPGLADTSSVFLHLFCLPTVLWRCWLGSRKGIRPVKKLEWWGTGMVICLEWDADLHMAQLMRLPLTVSCYSKIQIGFTFLVPAHPGSPGKRAVKRVCVCVVLEEIFGYKWHTLLWVKETQSTDPNHCFGLILSSSATRSPREKALFPLSALCRQHPEYVTW